MKSFSLLSAVAAVAFSTVAFAASSNVNTGSLGAAANGLNADPVTTTAGVVGGGLGGIDTATVYNNANGVNTTVGYNAALNPVSSSPFTIEFWAKPTTSDDDDAPVANRVSSGDRSGWAFFQRAAGTGWNFRMYNGVGSGTAINITGGTANLNAWSQVVAVWTGTSASLYVNGVQVVAPTAQAGTFAANTTQPLTLGTLPDQTSAYNGALDEVAFYGSALTGSQIAAHYSAVSGAGYYSLVRADGALLQLSSVVPEPTGVAAVGVIALAGLRRRR